MNQIPTQKPSPRLVPQVKNIAPSQFVKSDTPKRIIDHKNVILSSLKQFVLREIKRVNKDNAIYYFSGGTLIIMILIVLIPIIYGYLTRKPDSKIQIVSDNTTIVTTNNQNSQAPKIIELPKVADTTKKAVKAVSRDEMIGIFQKAMNENKTENLNDYIEPNAKLYFWSSSEKEVTVDYAVYVLRILNGEGSNWNFDQGQANIRKVQDIDGRFKDNYTGINNKNAIVGIKLSANNKIAEINIANDINAVFESIIPVDESLITG
jgi:hypothetical protein